MLRIAFAVFQKSTLAPYPASNPGKYPFYPVTLSGKVKFYLTGFTGLKVANASHQGDDTVRVFKEYIQS